MRGSADKFYLIRPGVAIKYNINTFSSNFVGLNVCLMQVLRQQNL